MMKRPKTVKKPWGKFEEYSTNEKTTVKIVTVNKGQVLSLQSHKNRKEIWIALDNGLTALIGNKKKKLKKGEIVVIPKKTKHRISASKKARFLEISFGKFDEKDIIRYEDKYGRA